MNKMRNSLRCRILGLLAITACAAESSPVKLADLRCEYLKDPLGIDSPNPRLSWVITSDQRSEKQSAYQVLVASSEDALTKDAGDFWDSGKVASDQSILVPYAGKELGSRMVCFWKVRVWDGRGQASPWSKSASWSMGLLNPEDWKAQWIGHPIDPALADAGKDKVTGKAKERPPIPAYYLRKEFTLPGGIRRATAWVCGLGFFELQVNGRKIGDHLMDPALSLYPKRAFYVTFDVTKELASGPNALGVTLGSGRFYFMRRTFGFPRLLMQLEVEHKDGTVTRVVSDGSWSCTDQGPIRSNQEYDGETYDARMEMPGWDRPGFTGSGWIQAEVQQPFPKSQMQAQMIEPMRITERLKPISVTPSPNPGAWLVDFGQNFYGNVKLRVSGKAGDQVSMTAAYSLDKSGKLFTAPNRRAKCTDIYTLKGGGVEEWHPVFVGRGFRRIEVKGFPGTPDASNFEGLAIHSDLESRGGFECSDPLINKLHSNYLWTARSYLRSVPMDPDRDERQGWTGEAKDPESQLWDLGVASFYGKWLDDHRYEQGAGGQLPPVIPSFQPWSGDILWPSTAVLIPETLYDYYGDLSALTRNYKTIKGFVDSGHNRKNKEGVLPTAAYADWCDASAMAPVRKRAVQNGSAPRYECGATPGGLLSTAYQYHNEMVLARFAKLLGKSEDVALYSQRAQATLAAFNAAYLNPATGIYKGSTQTGQALPLMLDMVPKESRDRVIAALIDDIMIGRQGHFSVGLIGTQWLMQTLTKIGRADVAYVLATQTTKPSWGYMVKKGATSIWERWDGDTGDVAMNSEMLLMLAGNLNAWFYQTLAGINVVPEAPGFKKILIKPHPLGDLTWVKAHHDSPYGRIESNWKREGDLFSLEVVIPPNTTASVAMPDKSTHEAGSGKHRFTCKWTPFVPPALNPGLVPAKTLESTEGYIASWMISGPHYQGVRAAALMETAFPPELPEGQAAWLHYDAQQAQGPRILQLGNVFDGIEHATYLKSVLKASAEINDRVEIATEAPVKLWLHGALVSAKTSEANKQVFEVTLRAGDNPLLIKTVQMKPDTLDMSVRLQGTRNGERLDVSTQAQ